MSSQAFNLVYWLLQAFCVAAPIAAWNANMLTTAQMQTAGIKKGMAYVWHLGMWNDGITVHAFLAFMAGMFMLQWLSGVWILVSIVVALVSVFISYKANVAWAKPTEIIQAHSVVAHDKIHSTGEMSLVGWIHVPHMAIILYLIAMSVIWILLGRVPWKLAVGGTFLLLAHACVGQHGILRQLNPSWNPWPQQWFDGRVLVLNVLLFAVAFYFLFYYALDR